MNAVTIYYTVCQDATQATEFLGRKIQFEMC